MERANASRHPERSGAQRRSEVEGSERDSRSQLIDLTRLRRAQANDFVRDGAFRPFRGCRPASTENVPLAHFPGVAAPPLKTGPRAGFPGASALSLHSAQDDGGACFFLRFRLETL